VHHPHPTRVRRQLLLVLEQEVRGLERVVAADRDERVDLEIDERAVDVREQARLALVAEVVGPVDALARVRARGADEDAARVAKPSQVALLEDAVVLIRQEPVRHRVVVLQVRVAVEEPDDLAIVLDERRRGGGDHRVGRRGGPAGEHDADAADGLPRRRSSSGV
jgi:hypothetical protein